jgi:hypothetical protein
MKKSTSFILQLVFHSSLQKAIEGLGCTSQEQTGQLCKRKRERIGATFNK